MEELDHLNRTINIEIDNIEFELKRFKKKKGTDKARALENMNRNINSTK